MNDAEAAHVHKGFRAAEHDRALLWCLQRGLRIEKPFQKPAVDQLHDDVRLFSDGGAIQLVLSPFGLGILEARAQGVEVEGRARREARVVLKVAREATCGPRIVA